MIGIIGFQVLDLVRTRIESITLKGLKEGQYRELKRKEIAELKRKVGMIR
jgi:16S rRNA U516 pseudouridylate synthase RsuA-like enzyme